MSFINKIIEISDEEYDQYEKKMYSIFNKLYIPA